MDGGRMSKSFFEDIEKSKKEVERKSEYLKIDICCPDEESVLMSYERDGKLTLEKFVEIHNDHKCCGCDMCNIPDFI